MAEFAASVAGIDISLIRQFNERKTDTTLDLGLGQLPYEQPPGLRKAGSNSFLHDNLGYGPTAGNELLRAAIAEDFNIAYGLGYSANNVAVTVGAEHALDCAYRAVLNPGDVVLIPEIYFSVYATLGSLAGATVKTYRLDEQHLPDLSHMEELLGEGASLVVLNSPANPTGAVLESGHLERIAELCTAHGKPWIISDEVYSKLTFTGSVAPTIASQYDRCLVVGSISKIASAAGVRIGWVISEVDAISNVAKVIQHSVTSASVAAQAAAQAYFLERDHTKTYVKRLEYNRNRIIEALAGTPLEGVAPAGSFYYFAPISQFGSSEEVALRLLENQDVLVIPGKAFGEAGDGFVRISFAADDEVLDEALNRIKTELGL